MVADEYLALRSRIGAALVQVAALGEAAGVQPPVEDELRPVVDGLTDPFLLAVVGEVNAGKSTLLNALFGGEFCETGPLPVTDAIHLYRYGQTRKTKKSGKTGREISLPLPFLRDFHLVDTPGVNSTAAGHGAITRDFLPRADAVLFCLPAGNPWAAAAWAWLGEICARGLTNVVLVLQQADLRSPAEVEAITAHMRLLCQQRIGRDLAVFPVSARLALLSRTSGLDKARLFAESRLGPLEDRISALVAAAPGRRAKLQAAVESGARALARVQALLAGRAAHDSRLAAASRAQAGALAAARQTLGERMTALSVGLTREWRTAAESLGDLAAALAPGFPALGGLPPLPEALTHPHAPGLRDIAGEFEAAVRQLAATTADALAEAARDVPGAPAPGKPVLVPAGRGEFAASLDAAGREALRWADLPGLVRQRGKRRRRWIAVAVIAALAFAATALGCSLAGFWALAGFSLWACLLSAAGGRLFSAMERLSTRRLVQETLLPVGETLVEGSAARAQILGEEELAPLDVVAAALAATSGGTLESGARLQGSAAALNGELLRLRGLAG